MNDHLIDAWNELVGPDDTVFVLGDICMGRLADSLLLVSRLHGTKHLIAGNHDRCWVGNDQPLSSVSARHRDYIDAGFASVSESGRVELVRQQVEMSHFPYKPATPSSDAERRPREVQYDRFRPIDTGGWLLHGHVHGAYRQLGRQINVGVDAWGGRPVSEDEIVQLIIDGERDLGPLPWECRA